MASFSFSSGSGGSGSNSCSNFSFNAPVQKQQQQQDQTKTVSSYFFLHLPAKWIMDMLLCERIYLGLWGRSAPSVRLGVRRCIVYDHHRVVIYKVSRSCI